MKKCPVINLFGGPGAGITSLSDYNGEMTVDGLKAFAKKGMTHDALQKIWDSRGIGADFNKMVSGELGVMDRGTLANKQLARAVRSMSLTENGTMDFSAGVSDVQKMTTDQLVDAGDGKSSLSPSMIKFLKGFQNGAGGYLQGTLSPDLIAKLQKGGSNFTFDNDTAKSISDSVDAMVQNNPFLSGLTKQASAVQDAHDSFVGGKDGTKDLPTLVQDILNKIDGLSSITDAINSLTSTISGTAHQ